MSTTSNIPKVRELFKLFLNARDVYEQAKLSREILELLEEDENAVI